MRIHAAAQPRPLLLLACSGLKLDRPAKALDLYRGVMYGTYRAHVQPAAAPHLVILSALHGFISPDAVLAPYDQRMTPARADDMLAHLGTRYLANGAWPQAFGDVLLAGGQEYRRVMRGALQWFADCKGITPASVRETSGGIGRQRAQLGAFLRGQGI